MGLLGVYRTDQGTIFRIAETIETGPKVEVLRGDVWLPGPVAMFGLRLESSTRKLSPAAIEKLPD
jgi:hypothetical protein